MRTARRVVAVVLLWAAGAQAQTALTGKWHGQTPGGFDVVLELTAADGALNGTVTREGRPSVITDGKVSNDTFTFKASLDEQLESITGHIGTDTITAWLDRQGPSAAITFTRVASGLSGRWQGQTPNGFPLVLELTATASTLGGILERDGQPTPIEKGTVAAETFAFQATLGGQTETLSGKLDGDRIRVWLDRQGPSAAAVLNRVVAVK